MAVLAVTPARKQAIVGHLLRFRQLGQATLESELLREAMEALDQAENQAADAGRALTKMTVYAQQLEVVAADLRRETDRRKEELDGCNHRLQECQARYLKLEVDHRTAALAMAGDQARLVNERDKLLLELGELQLVGVKTGTVRMGPTASEEAATPRRRRGRR